MAYLIIATLTGSQTTVYRAHNPGEGAYWTHDRRHAVRYPSRQVADERIAKIAKRDHSVEGMTTVAA